MKYLKLLRAAWAAAFLATGLAAVAQQPAVRLAGSIADRSEVVLPHSRNPRTVDAPDLGAVAPDTAVNGMTLVFSRSAAQETALQSLIAAQQDPASPLYHQWLTPETFAARFGVNDTDIATVQSWLQSQGFSVNSIARSRDRITFSGTAGQVAAAFKTELHRFKVDAETHFAPNSDLSLPASLAPMVTSIQHLSNFRLKPSVRYPATLPAYTSNQSGAHFLSPKDLATMYDVNAVYSAGYDGAGQAIAIAGQSYINLNDVTAFQQASGLPTKAPNLVLIPNSGTSAIYYGDEGESDLDVEWSGGVAPGATIYLVYAGDSPTYGVLDSVAQAVIEDIAPIVTLSYGNCETAYAAADLNNYNQIAEQATVQGQTLITSSGDDGSTTCYGNTNLSSAQQQALAVDFPASSPYFTGIGGLQMQAGTFAVGNTTYWGTATGSDNIGSLLSYVPETTWNEDRPPTTSSTGGIASGGGGTSAVFLRPTWQAGVPGIPTGANRLVPDISLQGSSGSPGYLYCSSDPTSLASTQTTSCSNGYRDSATGLLTVAGGTSFGAPIFGGLVAILNQATHSTGQGNVNPTLYSLAGNAATYASAFHDITTGTNACTAGTTFCSTVGASAYAAGVGYDEATGLGSIDFARLVAAWPATTAATLAATTTTAALTSATITAASTQQVTLTVASAGATGNTPTGTVKLTLDGTVLNPALALTSGAATASFTAPTATGTHILVATYAGDSTHAPSYGSVSFTIGSLTAIGSFAIAETPITVAYNGTAAGIVSITPAAGYNGSVVVGLSTSSTLPLCYSVNNVDAYTATSATAGAPATATTTLTIGEGTACSSTAARTSSGMKMVNHVASSRGAAPAKPWKHWPAPVAFAALLFGGLGLRRRSRRLPALLSLAVLAALGVGLSGCGSSGSSTQPVAPTTNPQTLTLTLTGVDSVESNLTASTTFTLTVH